MVFDRAQSTFPSQFQREVWWWAVGIVPLEESLPGAVREKCGPEVLGGCYQWHAYFEELCEDMYTHPEAYLPASARQYRDILENIAAGGEPRGDGVVWTAEAWAAYRDRLNRSKAYVAGGVSLDPCLKALGRAGLACGYAAGGVVFRQEKYPKIFHAMAVFERSPEVRQTPARHHFAHCEFRQLYKNYSDNFESLIRRCSDESHDILHSVHEYCKSLKIQRYIHYGITKHKYRGVRVADFNFYGDEYPTLRINMGTCADPSAELPRDEYYHVLLGRDRDIQKKFIEHLVRCTNPEHRHYPVVINGREERLCPCERIRINPLRADLPALEAFIAARKASIDQYCDGTAK